MTIGIFASIEAFTPAVEAFASGLETHNISYKNLRYKVPDSPEKYTAFVVCGLEGALKLKNNFPKHHVILIDAGFINDYNNPHYNEMRRTNYSVAFMEEDGTRTYVHQTAPPDRWQEKNYQSLVNDWTSGDYVLLTMQSHPFLLLVLR